MRDNVMYTLCDAEDQAGNIVWLVLKHVGRRFTVVACGSLAACEAAKRLLEMETC